MFFQHNNAFSHSVRSEVSPKRSVRLISQRQHILQPQFDNLILSQRAQTDMMSNRQNEQLQEYVNANLYMRNQQQLQNNHHYESPVQSLKHLEAIARIVKFSKDGMLMKKYTNLKQQMIPDEPHFMKGGIQPGCLPFSKDRKIKSLPKNQGFHLKRPNAAVYIQNNASKLQSQDLCAQDLKLIGNQFQSKANPDNFIHTIEQRKSSQDCTDARELLLFLKRRYHELPTKRDCESKLRAIKRKIEDQHVYKDNIDEQFRRAQTISPDNIDLIDETNASILDCSSQSRQPKIEGQKTERIFTSQFIRHRKLISVMNNRKQNNQESHRESQFAPLNVRAQQQNLQKAKDSGRDHTKKSEIVSQSTVPISIDVLISQSNDHELLRKNNQQKNLKAIKKGGAVISQPLYSNNFENDEERIERMYRFQKEVKAKYNGISVTQNTITKEEPYKYIVIRGNNSELIKRALDERNGDWQELQSTNTLFNFKWIPFSKGIRFDYLSSHGQKKMVNHFEFQEQISEKDNLFNNMTKYCESVKKNVFSVLPVTFVVDLSQNQSFTEIERFQTYFNILEKHKHLPEKLSLISKELAGNHLFPATKSKSSMKYSLCENMFDGNNFWLLKPTDFNRGRGVQVFNTLEQLKKLLIEYQQGVEVKFNSAQPPSQLNAVINVKETGIKKQTLNPIGQSAAPPIIGVPQEQQLSNFTNLDGVLNIVKTDAFVVQKYLEKPLLIKKRKFDIRLWVLVNHEGKVYLFKEGYIRTSSYEHDVSPESIEKPFIHLTNNAVQKYDEKYGTHEEGNQLSFQQAQDLIREDGIECDMYAIVGGTITSIIRDTMKSVEPKLNQYNRKFCMEIFGYDFIIDSQLNPWLIEVNTNPCLEESSSLLKKLIPRMVEDSLKLTVDLIFPPKRQKQIPVDIIENEPQYIIASEPGLGSIGCGPTYRAEQFNKDKTSTNISSSDNSEREKACVKQFDNKQVIAKNVKESSQTKTKYSVSGYSDTENMWNLIYQLKA